jgi:hypothetical protein
MSAQRSRFQFTDVLLDVLTRTFDVERASNPKGSGERPPTLGLGQAFGTGVQPSAPARQPPTFVDDQLPVHRDHSQQLVGQSPLSASHTRSHRACRVILV